MRNNYLKEVRHELSDCRYVVSLSHPKPISNSALVPPASSSAKQNSPPAPWARPPKTPKQTASTSSRATCQAPSACSSPTAPRKPSPPTSPP
jgi:hypothetical protein